MFILFGYAPNEYAIRHLNVVEGDLLGTNHQILLGRAMAEAMNKSVGESIEVGGVRFKVVGIYESNMVWEELGGVVSLRDAQTFMGRPRKVTMYMVKTHDPNQAEAVLANLEKRPPKFAE